MLVKTVMGVARRDGIAKELGRSHLIMRNQDLEWPQREAVSAPVSHNDQGCVALPRP